MNAALSCSLLLESVEGYDWILSGGPIDNVDTAPVGTSEAVSFRERNKSHDFLS